MDVVILCGGRGERLRPVLPGLPKVLAPVHGRPFLEILLGYLEGQGLGRVVLCGGYKADAIGAFCQRATGTLSLVLSREPRLLGTAGALKNAEALIETPELAVMNGDSLCAIGLHELAHHHQQAGARVTMAICQMDDVGDYGAVELGPRNEIVGFTEKPGGGRPGFVNAGVYVMSRSVLDEIPAGQPCSLERDLFPALVGRGLSGYVGDWPLLDIGTPERLQEAQSLHHAR